MSEQVLDVDHLLDELVELGNPGGGHVLRIRHGGRRIVEQLGYFLDRESGFLPEVDGGQLEQPVLVEDPAAARPSGWCQQPLSFVEPQGGGLHFGRRCQFTDIELDSVDTAEAYGPWTNEELIRQALHPYSDVVIATKGGGIRPGPNQWEALGRPGFIRQGVETSLHRLGVECIDLYQLHRIDPEVPLADTLGLDFREWDHVIDYCHREGMAFIAWGPLGSGTRDPLDAIGQADGLQHVSATQVALAWLLHRAPNTVAIPGTASLRHLEENVAAAGLRLTDEQVEQLSMPSPE